MPIFLRIALDITAGFIVLILAILISRNDIPIILWMSGAFFGVLPDGLTFLLFLNPRNRILSTFLKMVYAIHRKIHYDKEKKGLPPLRVGLSTQAVAIILALYLLIF